MKNCVVVATLWLTFLPVLSLEAQELTLEELEAIVKEQQEATYSINCRFTIHSEAFVELDSFASSTSFNRPTQREFVAESGKFYSYTHRPWAELGSSTTRTTKDSWNGSERYGSTETANGEARSNIYGDFARGNTGDNQHVLDRANIKMALITGSYDAASPREYGKTSTPLDVFNRVKQRTGKTGEESLRLERVERDGGMVYVLSLVKNRTGITMSEHTIDPSLEFSCIESRFYNLSGGLDRFTTRNYVRDAKGALQIASMTNSETVWSLAFTAGKMEELDPSKYAGISNFYVGQDMDKIGRVQHFDFEMMEFNQPIDPSVYEKENVFIMHGAIWDERTGTEIQPSYDRIQADTLRSVSRLLAELDVDEATDSSAIAAQGEGVAEGIPAVAAGGVAGESYRALLFGLGGVALLLVVAGFGWRWTRGRRVAGFLIALSTLGMETVFAADAPLIDLGVIGVHEKSAEAIYTYTNENDFPVHVKNLKTSCGCTTGKLPGHHWSWRNGFVYVCNYAERRSGQDNDERCH